MVKVVIRRRANLTYLLCQAFYQKSQFKLCEWLTREDMDAMSIDQIVTLASV